MTKDSFAKTGKMTFEATNDCIGVGERGNTDLKKGDKVILQSICIHKTWSKVVAHGKLVWVPSKILKKQDTWANLGLKMMPFIGPFVLIFEEKSFGGLFELALDVYTLKPFMTGSLAVPKAEFQKSGYSLATTFALHGLLIFVMGIFQMKKHVAPESQELIEDCDCIQSQVDDHSSVGSEDMEH